MGYENILYEKKDGIAYITFNRPKVLNALNRQTIEELRSALLDAREDSKVRVLILTGAGEKSFVAGADISELGKLPGYGGSQRLTRLCGKGVAHELCLTGEMISAEEAQRIGLVNHVCEPAELMPAAEAMAKKIIANAPLAVRYCMEAIERGAEMPQEEGLYLEATLFGLCCATEDMREGTRAFLEKRTTQFRGK